MVPRPRAVERCFFAAAAFTDLGFVTVFVFARPLVVVVFASFFFPPVVDCFVTLGGARPRASVSSSTALAPAVDNFIL